MKKQNWLESLGMDSKLSKLQFAKGAPPVIEYEGRWYITANHPGFNSPSNNAFGYESKARAEAAIVSYTTKGKNYRKRHGIK